MFPSFPVFAVIPFASAFFCGAGFVQAGPRMVAREA